MASLRTLIDGQQQQQQQSATESDHMIKPSIAQLLRLPILYTLQSLPQMDNNNKQSSQSQKHSLQNLLEPVSQDTGKDYTWDSDLATPTAQISLSSNEVDAELRANLLSLLNSPMNHHIAKQLPLSVLKKFNINQRPQQQQKSAISNSGSLSQDTNDLSSGQQDWELLTPMKKSSYNNVGNRYRRSILLKKRQQQHLASSQVVKAARNGGPTMKTTTISKKVTTSH